MEKNNLEKMKTGIMKIVSKKDFSEEIWDNMVILKKASWENLNCSYSNAITDEEKIYSEDYLRRIRDSSGSKTMEYYMGGIVQIGIYMGLSRVELEDIFGIKFDPLSDIDEIYIYYLQEKLCEKKLEEASKVIEKLKAELNYRLVNWNKIYEYETGEEEKYSEQYDKNKTLYKELPEYDKIDDCVKYAIETGNHAAFAKYFLNKGKTNNELFKEIVEKYMEDKKFSDNEWDKMKIIDKATYFWRNKDFNYEDEKLGFYKIQTLQRWRKGDNLPGHDEIVQIGFYMHLSSDEVDKMLIAAGKEVLYDVDIFDIISKHYLDYYKDNKEKSTDAILKEVKSEINKAIDKIASEDESMKWITSMARVRKNQLSGRKRVYWSRLHRNGMVQG